MVEILIAFLQLNVVCIEYNCLHLFDLLVSWNIRTASKKILLDFLFSERYLLLYLQHNWTYPFQSRPLHCWSIFSNNLGGGRLRIFFLEIIIIIIIIYSLEFFTSANADGLSLEFEWQQVSSSLQDSSQCSGRSQ